VDASEHRGLLERVWEDYGDRRRVIDVTEESAMVSTNRVYRLSLDDGDEVYAKVSSYGSYFLFAEDHDRIHRCVDELRGTRFEGMLADVLTRDGRIYTWYDERQWAVLYRGVERRRGLGRILSDGEIEQFAREIAAFHMACTEMAPRIPLTSKSIKSDAIHLLDLLESPFAPRNFELPPEHIGVLRRHTHDFLMRLEDVRYDYWTKIPVLIDWNLGNFSVTGKGGDFELFSRWDYDWFRIEPRMLDFYFLSRVSSRTGDRTQFTYGSNTLVEPRFQRFIAAYHRVMPLSAEDVRFLPEVYRFFILNYVIREGARFFRPDYCAKFRREAVTRHLPGLEHLDISPLLDIVS
jgi:hypothetical protein